MTIRLTIARVFPNALRTKTRKAAGGFLVLETAPKLSAQLPPAAPAGETTFERAFALDEGKQQPRATVAASVLHQAAAAAGDALAHCRLGPHLLS